MEKLNEEICNDQKLNQRAFRTLFYCPRVDSACLGSSIIDSTEITLLLANGNRDI